MRLLQRYILGELLKVFSILLSIMTVLLVFVGVFREVTESGLGPTQAAQILPFVVPSLMPFTIPATLLLTVCLVYGRISGDQEVTAAKAAGINVMSLLWPALLLGVALSAASFALTDRVIPWAVGNIERIVTGAMEDIFLDVLRSKHVFSDPKRGVSVLVMDVQDRTLIRPTFRYAPAGRAPVTIQSHTAQMEFDLKRREVILHLVGGHIDVAAGRTVVFEKEDYPFPLPKELRETKARNLSIQDLEVKLDEFRDGLDAAVAAKDARAFYALTLGEFETLARGEFYRDDEERPFVIDSRKYRMEIHNRLAMSTSCFFFALIGGPFSMLQARRQFLTSFILCFVPILVVYYPLVLGMGNLCKTGQANPVWAMWVGNAVLLVAGLHILRKVLKN